MFTSVRQNPFAWIVLGVVAVLLVSVWFFGMPLPKSEPETVEEVEEDSVPLVTPEFLEDKILSERQRAQRDHEGLENTYKELEKDIASFSKKDAEQYDRLQGKIADLYEMICALQDQQNRLTHQIGERVLKSEFNTFRTHTTSIGEKRDQRLDNLNMATGTLSEGLRNVSDVAQKNANDILALDQKIEAQAQNTEVLDQSIQVLQDRDQSILILQCEDFCRKAESWYRQPKLREYEFVVAQVPLDIEVVTKKRVGEVCKEVLGLTKSCLE